MQASSHPPNPGFPEPSASKSWSPTKFGSCQRPSCFLFCSHLRLYTSLFLLAQWQWFPGDSPYFLPRVNCTKRNKGLKEAKQYFIDSQKTDMDCTQPWKTFLKSQTYQQENSFLINNLTPLLCQKILVWNVFPLQFNVNSSFQQLKNYVYNTTQIFCSYF